RVSSIAAALSGLLTRRFPTRSEIESAAPPMGIPSDAKPGRPRSWIVENRPGSRMRRNPTSGTLGWRAKGRGGDRLKADPIADREQSRGVMCDVKELQRRAADELPTAGSHVRVNASLSTSDADAAGRNARARLWQARRGELRRQAAEIRKA